MTINITVAKEINGDQLLSELQSGAVPVSTLDLSMKGNVVRVNAHISHQPTVESIVAAHVADYSFDNSAIAITRFQERAVL